MKTTTVRLDDDQAALVEEIAELDSCKTSDVLRSAVGAYLRERTAHDPRVASRVQEFLDRRVRDTVQEAEILLGATNWNGHQASAGEAKSSRRVAGRSKHVAGER